VRGAVGRPQLYVGDNSRRAFLGDINMATVSKEIADNCKGKLSTYNFSSAAVPVINRPFDRANTAYPKKPNPNLCCQATKQKTMLKPKPSESTKATSAFTLEKARNFIAKTFDKSTYRPGDGRPP
jgi:hypothetical protein